MAQRYFWRSDGTEFGFDLETRLIDGCVIFHKNGGDYIVRQLRKPFIGFHLKARPTPRSSPGKPATSTCPPRFSMTRSWSFMTKR
jgi:hypothetical protein